MNLRNFVGKLDIAVVPLGVVSAVLLATLVSMGLSEVPLHVQRSYQPERIAPILHWGHVVSALTLTAGVTIPAVLGVLYVRRTRRRFTGTVSVLVGLSSVAYSVLAWNLATANCAAPGPMVAMCVRHPWWVASIPAAVGYLLGGIGLTVSGLLALSIGWKR